MAARDSALELIIDRPLSYEDQNDLDMPTESATCLLGSFNVSCRALKLTASERMSTLVTLCGMEHYTLNIVLLSLLEMIRTFTAKDPKFSLESLEISLSSPTQTLWESSSKLLGPCHSYMRLLFKTSVTTSLTQLKQCLTDFGNRYPLIYSRFWTDGTSVSYYPKTIVYYSRKAPQSLEPTKTKNLHQGLDQNILHHCHYKSALQTLTKFATVFEYRHISLIEESEAGSMQCLEAYLKTLDVYQLSHTIVLYTDHLSGIKVNFCSEWKPNTALIFDDECLTLCTKTCVVIFFNLLGYTFRDMIEVGCLEKPKAEFTSKSAKVTNNCSEAVRILQNWLSSYAHQQTPCRIEASTLVESTVSTLSILDVEKSAPKSSLSHIFSHGTHPVKDLNAAEPLKLLDSESIADSPPSYVLLLTIIADKLQLSYLSDISEEIERYCNHNSILNVLKIKTLTSQTHSCCPCSFDALEITFSSIVKKNQLLENLRRLPLPPSVSINIQKAKSRLHCKRVAIFDMDSTLIQQECIEEMATASSIPTEEIKAITAKAMNGETSFNEALNARIGLFKGIRASTTFEKVRSSIKFTPCAKTLITLLKRLGVRTAVVSGGFQDIVEYVCDELGLDEGYGNYLEIDHKDAFTGRLKPEMPLIDAVAKCELTHLMKARAHVSERAMIAVADGANDLFMISSVGLGIAFMAKPFLKKIALII